MVIQIALGTSTSNDMDSKGNPIVPPYISVIKLGMKEFKGGIYCIKMNPHQIQFRWRHENWDKKQDFDEWSIYSTHDNIQLFMFVYAHISRSLTQQCAPVMTPETHKGSLHHMFPFVPLKVAALVEPMSTYLATKRFHTRVYGHVSFQVRCVDERTSALLTYKIICLELWNWPPKNVITFFKPTYISLEARRRRRET